MKTRQLFLLLLGLTVAACADFGDDRIDNIQKLKVLAVKAGHPDLLPGETTTIEVLVASPETGEVSTTVMPMPHGDQEAGKAFAFAAGNSAPAAPVTSVVLEDATPRAAQLFYTAPQAPGRYDLSVLVGAGSTQSFHPDTALKSIKTVRVRNQGEPLNENPKIAGVVPTKRWKVVKDNKRELSVEGLRVEPEEVVRLEAVFTDETPDRASVVWWFTAGEAEDYGRHDVDFVAPKTPGIVTVVALVLDHEGGCDWLVQRLAVGVDLPAEEK